MDRTSSGEMNQLSKGHKCPVCQKELATKTSLKSHTRRLHSDGLKPIVCNLCPKSFHTKHELNLHIVRHHTKIYPFNCSRCPKIFASASQLKDHLSGHTKVGLRECPNCGKQFTNASALWSHQLIHSDVYPHTCTVCSRGFKRLHKLTAHMEVHSVAKPFKCDRCPLEFRLKSGLKSHSRVHDSLVCSDCGNEYKSNSSLRLHRITMHADVSNFICPVCGVPAINAARLDNHVRRHTGEKPFKCEECDKSYSSESGLRSHAMFHKGRTHKCTLCEFATAEKSKVTRHMRTVHSDERPFCCKFCPRQVKTKIELQQHIRTHTKEKPYPCEVCAVSFSQPSTLKAHKLTHTKTNRMDFKCDPCGKEFRTKQQLKYHMKRYACNRT